MAIATTAIKPKPKLTYEDYASLPDDERCELIDGELMPMPSPTALHQTLLKKLALGFMVLESRGLGTMFFAPLDVILSNFDVVQPDLIFISNERAHIIDDYIRGAPDLVVEILSPSTAGYDRTTKRNLYARHAVREYWLIDPYTKTVTALILGANGYDTYAVFGEGDILTSPTLAGFALNLSDLF